MILELAAPYFLNHFLKKVRKATLPLYMNPDMFIDETIFSQENIKQKSTRYTQFVATTNMAIRVLREYHAF